MSYHARPSTDEYSDFFARYLARVPDGDIVAILRDQIADTVALLDAVPADREDHAYAEGKWTIKEVVGHLADAERVLAYRALRIARGDGTPLSGFDENAYVPAGRFGGRALAEITAELETVRRATVALFEGLPESAWTRRGTASAEPVTVRALACIIAGHELHHRALLEERYGLGAASGR